MHTMRSLKTLSTVALLAMTLVACRKDKDEAPDLDYTSASDNARAEDAFNDILTQVDQAAKDNGLRDDCAPVVTFDTVATPHTITLDFGDVNCTTQSGRLRRGRIQVSYTGRYRDEGTVITMTPVNYYVNNNLVLGTKTVTNMGLNEDGHPYFAIVVNGSLTAADGSWTATHQAQRTRTWVNGSDTETWLDDVYMITGGGSGVNRNGVSYTTSITNGLRVEIGCPWITQGTVVVTPASRPERTIDYGSGTCDGTFSITINGQTYTITIG